MQINRFNFIRWFTNQAIEQTINIPRLSARQPRVYCPVIALGEAFSFYINCDIPFSDTDTLRLDLVGTAGTFTNVAPLSKDVIPNNGGYNIFCNGTLNGIPTGQYQFVIKNGANQKCISNPIQVMSAASAEQTTVSVLYRNSRSRSRFRYFENTTFQNKIRLTVSLVDWTAEGNLEQYREVSTGTLRNEKLELDRKIKISTYFFDDGAHEAMTELGVSDSIIINGRNYRAKGIYNPAVRESAHVSKGEIELYEVDFSKINKYGKLTATVIPDPVINPNIAFPWSTSHGSNPVTQCGFSINSPYIVQQNDGSNNFGNSSDSLFKKGDLLQIDLTSLTNNHPWELNSSAEIEIKVNDLRVHFFEAFTQADIMNTFNLQTDNSTNKVEIIVKGKSNSTNRVTRKIDTYLFDSDPGQLRLQLGDDSDSKVKLNVYPVLGGNQFLYNVINDGSTLTGYIQNVGEVDRYIYFEGNSFTFSGTVPAGGQLPIPGIPKSGNTYLYSVESAGYVRRAEFTRNNCGAGSNGGVFVFAKSYPNQAAANADTANFNALGQARANQYGSCS
jgi:hypothetical protein